MARPRPTLTDYVVIGINPLLIMTLVGSLVFFLLAVFYQGQFEARLHFIMGMFVMAAVLIGRISIEEGREYATLFAVPLAIVTALATFRFVEFHGALAGWSRFLNLGLIALIWWSADRLTWDCTVIDESEDASGEGLLQTVGLEGDAGGVPPGTDGGRDLEGTTDRERPPANAAVSAPGLWQRFLQYRRRQHAPGVWVVYFSLAALPLFGLGQWAVGAAGLEGRRHMFQLLVVYVASALGLLLTTSFLGLRRYLRQRRLAMPAEMAAVWLMTGAVLIVGILLFCLILPRRNPEYSVTHLSWLAGSPDNQRTSRYGFGRDGPQKQDADRTGGQAGEASAEASQSGQQQGGKRGDGAHSAHADSQQQPSGPANQPQPSSDSSDERNAAHSGGDPADKSGQPASGRQSAGKQQAGKQRTGESSSAGPSKPATTSQPDADREQPSDTSSAGRPEPGESQTPRDGPHDDGAGKTPDRSGPRDSSDSDRSRTEPPPQRQPERDQQRADEDASASDSRTDSRSQQPASDKRPEGSRASESSSSRAESRWDPSRLVPQLGAGLGKLIRFLYWLAVIAIIGYLLWRYWAQVLEAVRNFVRSLREFWARLFGGARSAEELDAVDSAAVVAPPRPFAEFSDPFVTGAADRWSREELLRYSFQAFEAWARERGCPRSPEQTPSEFALSVAGRERKLARDALQVAELYNLSAYAGRGSSTLNVAPLRRLWQALRSESWG